MGEHLGCDPGERLGTSEDDRRNKGRPDIFPESSLNRRGSCKSIVRKVPRENSTATAPTKTTKRKVPANDTAVVNTSVAPRPRRARRR
jgi:hypothetical protein